VAGTTDQTQVAPQRVVASTPVSGDVLVRATVLRDIARHAEQAAPNECCGLLIGTGAGVESVHPARNLRQSPTRYLVDPADHFAAIKSSRQAGLVVVGAYHSHPTSSAWPSQTDEQEASDADFLYLIVSLVTGETRGFRLVEGRLQAVPLRVAGCSLSGKVRRSSG